MAIIIGTSTSWVHKNNLKFNEHFLHDLVDKAKINAVEFGFEDGFLLTDHSFVDRLNFSKFKHISIHLPEPPNRDHRIKSMLKFTKHLKNKYHKLKVVVHAAHLDPEIIKELKEAGLSISVENMDIRHRKGYKLKELERIVKEFNLNLVIDLQHAYEHDPSMRYVKRIFNRFKDNITHLHVSGHCRGHIHSLVKKASNKKKIIEAVKLFQSYKKYPIILEPGNCHTIQDIAEDVKFLKKAIG